MATFLVALINTFLLIGLGTIVAVLKLIDGAGQRGIGTFIGLISLPALLFNQMAVIDVSKIDWAFVGAVCFAKVFVFALVAGGTLLFDTNKQQRLTRAGINAIFATQSNDFALGLPILKSLYADSHPSFISVIFIVAPVSLALLNPLGFIMIGLDRAQVEPQPSLSAATTTSSALITAASCSQLPTSRTVSRGPGTTETTDDSTSMSRRRIKSPRDGQRHRGNLVRRTMARVLRNPVVVMTFTGLLWNLIFKHQLFSFLEEFTSTLGDAFTACALLLTGMSFAGKMGSITPRDLLLPAVLSACKVIVMPACILFFLMLVGGESDVRHLGIIYGVVPTAPSVLVYAQQHDMDVRKVAVALVTCTSIAGPLLLVAGQIVSSLEDGRVQSYVSVVRAFEWFNVPALVGAIWVALSVLTCPRRRCKLKHRMLAQGCLAEALFHGAACTCLIFRTYTGSSPSSCAANFFFQRMGDNAGKVLIASIPLLLALSDLRGRRSPSQAVEWAVFAGSWSLSVLVATFLTSFGKRVGSEDTCWFMFGYVEYLLSIGVNLVVLVIYARALYLLKRSVLLRSPTAMRPPTSDAAASLNDPLLNCAPKVGTFGSLPDALDRPFPSSASAGDLAATPPLAPRLLPRHIAVSVDAASFKTAVPGLHFTPVQERFDDPAVLRTLPHGEKVTTAPPTAASDDGGSEVHHQSTSLAALTGYRFMVVFVFQTMLLLIELMVSVWEYFAKPSYNGSTHNFLLVVSVSLKAMQGLVMFLAFGCQPDQPMLVAAGRVLRRVRRAAELGAFNTAVTLTTSDSFDEAIFRSEASSSPVDEHGDWSSLHSEPAVGDGDLWANETLRDPQGSLVSEHTPDNTGSGSVAPSLGSASCGESLE